MLFIGGLLLASFWILRPFIPAILWAITLVVATWPLMLWVQRHTGNRRGLAVFIMTTAILLLLILPIWIAINTIATHIDVLGDIMRSALSMQLPPPPDWIRHTPLVGVGIADAWQRVVHSGIAELASQLKPYAGRVTQWVASAIGSLGGMFLQFLLTTIIAAMLYVKGELAAVRMVLFGRRLAGDRGEMAVYLAGQAIRSVALGVAVTALAQSIIGGVGLAITGLPFAGLLTALMFFLCLIQLGPGFVLVPAVIWLYYSNDVVWGTVLLVVTIVATTIDQFIRPVLIRKGADLPLLLIIAGVLGGLVAFGILGIFIGPTVLAVAYTLFNAWIAEGEAG